MVRMLSLVSSGKRAMAASISLMISLVGIFDGVGANLGPFSRMERSADVSGLLDKLTTQFSLLIFLGCKGSNIANHARMNDHQIDFKNARVIDKGDYRVRKTLESWHTAMTTEADNNAKSLPQQYSILIK